MILLPVYEFLNSNPMYATILIEDMVSPLDSTQSPLFCTVVSLTSYLCTHALSTASQRSIAYAGLSLNMILAMVENTMIMEFISQTNVPSIQLCRQVCTYLLPSSLILYLTASDQRPPSLPTTRRASQPPVCSILNCCVLWLRHNLHKRLEVQSYT